MYVTALALMMIPVSIIGQNIYFPFGLAVVTVFLAARPQNPRLRWTARNALLATGTILGCSMIAWPMFWLWPTTFASPWTGFTTSALMLLLVGGFELGLDFVNRGLMGVPADN